MTGERTSPFSLATRPCLVDIGRFRWDIYNNDSLFQPSADAFDTEDEAHANGMVELDRLENAAIVSA